MYVYQEKAKRYPNNLEYEFNHVILLHVKETMTERCAELREKQMGGMMLSHRLACINDLPAEEAIYHRRCLQYFMSPRNLDFDALSTIKGGAPPKKRGRPTGAVDELKKSAFVRVI